MIEYTKEIMPTTGEEIEFAIIETSEGNFTKMPKAVYDEIQAKQTQGAIN